MEFLVAGAVLWGFIGALVALRRNQRGIIFGSVLAFVLIITSLINSEYMSWVFLLSLIALGLLPQYCPLCKKRISPDDFKKKKCPNCGNFPPRSFWGTYKIN